MSMPNAEVLVVDDEPGVARLCERVLKRAGFKVEAVTQPKLGVSILQQRQVDLLLLDIRMPEMDGFQLMTIARRHQPDLAVVIMTGFGTVETAIEALRQGADGLILKPFEKTSELVRSVEEALEVSRNKREVARLQALRPLFTITESLFSETRPERLLDLILSAICGHIRCEHAGYYRRGANNQVLNLVAKKGQPLPDEASSAVGGPVARSDALGMTLRFNSDGPGEPALQSLLLKHGLGSVLCAPLSRDVEHSVLLAGRDVGEPNFSAADVEMFGILTRQAAVALENARLYAELRDYVLQVEESQQALIQAEKMAAVGRLTASIAHEINNPLQGLGNCLHLARRNELESKQRDDYLKLADGELERLMSTVQRMLDFYRPSNLDRHISDANELINRVLILLQKQLDEHNVRVHKQLTEPLPKVLVVENQIQQVFFNLILNAMDAMPGGGNLTIYTQGSNGFVDIFFRDTGTGVPDEVKERIFEPFLSTRDGGTGLGLSVSYNILDAHGGSIILVPDQIEGACFRVRLPIMETT